MFPFWKWLFGTGVSEMEIADKLNEVLFTEDSDVGRNS